MRSLCAALLLLFVSAGTVGCMEIEQGPCAQNESMCIDGTVWVCRADGSGWDRHVACPEGRCEDGACVLDPLPSFDAFSPADTDLAEDSESGQDTPPGN